MKNNFTIDECLGFVANRLVKVFYKAFDHELEEHSLTSAQFCVLAKLLEEEGLTQTELAARLFIESPTLVRTLDKMELSGFIERRSVPTDRRAHHIFLKPKGKKMRKMVNRIGRQVHEKATAGLTPERIEELKDSLNTIWHNLEGMIEKS